MHEDELGRRIAELVADNTDRATPPPVAAIRRRGRRRHARLASGAMLLIAAMAAGLIAVQGPLRRQVTPVPVVTQPPRPIQPTSSFAAYVRGKFQDKVVDMTIVVLASGKTGGYHWQLAAVHGTSRLTHKAKVCLVHQADGASHPYGYVGTGTPTGPATRSPSPAVRRSYRCRSGGWFPRGPPECACCGRGGLQSRSTRWIVAWIPATLLRRRSDLGRPNGGGPGCAGPPDRPLPPCSLT